MSDSEQTHQEISVEQAVTERAENEPAETDNESAPETPAEDDTMAGDEPAGAMPFSVIVNGEPVSIDTETTAAELGEIADVSDTSVFTHRTSGSIEALADADVVADELPEGAEIWTQPLSDPVVFGTNES